MQAQIFLELDAKTAGLVKRFQVQDRVPWIKPMPDGTYLRFARNQGMRLLDATGNEIHKYSLPAGINDALLLRNGNIIALYGYRICEYTPDSRVVREHAVLEAPYRVSDCLGMIRLGFDAPRPVNLNPTTNIADQIRKLNDKDTSVRREMIEILRKLGPKDVAAIPTLIETWDDPDIAVWPYTCQAVASVGAPALPYVWKATKDKRSRVRALAVSTLTLIDKGDSQVWPVPIILQHLY